jgi:SAM-dependent methyltransferase
VSETPYDPNFYAVQAGGSYRSARRIVPLLLERMAVGSVLDVGCGVGTFLRVFGEHGVGDIQGVDGDYVPRGQLLIDAGRFLGRDLGEPLDLGRRFDLVMSLEVAEHLPEALAGRFVDNLCRHGSVVLFSAAIPGQGGTHHVNERWPGYWAGLFAERGYRVLDILRPLLWNDGEVEYWYCQNCLLFADDRGMAALQGGAGGGGDVAVPGALLDLVHPRMHMAKAREAAQVETARTLQATLERLCADGGAYAFTRTADGRITICRT